MAISRRSTHHPSGSISTPPTAKKATRSRCMGRSRGGLTTKIHALVDAFGLPILLKLAEGQVHDGRSAQDMLGTLGLELLQTWTKLTTHLSVLSTNAAMRHQPTRFSVPRLPGYIGLSDASARRLMCLYEANPLRHADTSNLGKLQCASVEMSC